MDPKRQGLQRDSLLAALAELPERDLDPTRARQILARAHAELAAADGSRASSVLSSVYNRFLEPALVVGVGSVYLVWAFRTVSALLMMGPG